MAVYVRKTLAKKRHSGGRGGEETDGGEGGKVLRTVGLEIKRLVRKERGREGGGERVRGREGEREGGGREGERVRGGEGQRGREGEISFFTLCSGV